MEFSPSFKKGFLLISACYCALGVALLCYPSLSLQTVSYALGATALLYSLMHLIGYFATNHFGDVYRFDFVTGVLFLCVGIYAFAQAYVVSQFLSTIISLAILLDSLIKLQNALDLHRLHSSTWWSVLACAAVTSVLGVMLLMMSFHDEATLVRFMGITLAVDGIANGLSFSLLARKLRQLRNAVEKELAQNFVTDNIETPIVPTV